MRREMLMESLIVSIDIAANSLIPFFSNEFIFSLLSDTFVSLSLLLLW